MFALQTLLQAALSKISDCVSDLRPRWWILGLFGVGSVATEFVLSAPRGRFDDFKIAYYPAGVAALHGTSLSALIAQGVTGFVNLPLVAYLFAPFAVLPWRVAAAGPFSLAGLAAIATAYILLVRLTGLGVGARFALLMLFAVNGPLIYSFKLGNTSHFVLLALVAALCLLRAGRSAGAGALLALAALIKLPLLLFGAYFVIRRDWAGAAGFAAVLVVAGGLSLLAFGPAVHAEWLDLAVVQFSHRVLAAFNVQSIPALLIRLRDPAPSLLDWTALDPTFAERIGARALQAVFAAAGAWGFWLTIIRPSNGGRTLATHELQFLLMLVLALLLSPLSWSHYYCWLLIPAAFALGGRLPLADSPALFWTSCAAIALSSPLVVFPDLTTPFFVSVYTRLVVSNYFFGGVLWLAALVLACRYAMLPPRAVSEAV